MKIRAVGGIGLIGSNLEPALNLPCAGHISESTKRTR